MEFIITIAASEVIKLAPDRYCLIDAEPPNNCMVANSPNATQKDIRNAYGIAKVVIIELMGAGKRKPENIGSKRI
jgi:hypothetical protein